MQTRLKAKSISKDEIVEVKHETINNEEIVIVKQEIVIEDIDIKQEIVIEDIDIKQETVNVKQEIVNSKGIVVNEECIKKHIKEHIKERNIAEEYIENNNVFFEHAQTESKIDIIEQPITINLIKFTINMIDIMTNAMYNHIKPIKGIYYHDNKFTIWCMCDDKFIFTTMDAASSILVWASYVKHTTRAFKFEVNSDTETEILSYPNTTCWPVSYYQTLKNKLKIYEESKKNLVESKNIYKNVSAICSEACKAAKIAHENVINSVKAFKKVKDCSNLSDKKKYFDAFVRANNIYLKMLHSLEHLDKSFTGTKINMVYHGKIWIRNAKQLCY